MFVSGEVAEPLPETTGLVEDIVRAQVVEMVLAAAHPPILTTDCSSYSSSGASVVKVHFSRRLDFPNSSRSRQGEPAADISIMEGCAEEGA